MKSSSFRRLLVCSLLIITMVPVLLSTLPSFQALACDSGRSGNAPIATFAIAIASCGGHQGPGGYHTGNADSNNSTTTSMSSP